MAGTLGGIVGSAVGTTILSLLSYPIFSNQKGANHPGQSAPGSGFGVEKSGELLGQKTHGLRTYFTSGITAGSTFYGSFVLGKGLKTLTDDPSVKQSINVAVGSLTLSTPLASSSVTAWNYPWENR